MKAAKTWCLASLVVMAGISSASCGKDDFTRGSGGAGTVLGGSGGSAGSAGTSTGGNVGRGGGGGGNTPTVGNLGKACVNDSQCADPAAPGLTCLTGKETVLDNGAPPKGMCTSTCTTDDECAAFAAGSICYPFGADAQIGY